MEELNNPTNPQDKEEIDNLPQQEETPVIPTTEETPGVDGNVDVLSILANIDTNTLLKSEAVQTLLENARKQEKNKLYKTISDLTQSNNDLKAELKTKEDATMEGEKELLQQIADLKEGQASLLKELNDQKELTRKEKLDRYKADKIGEANGEIIVDLVKGSTEEEIDASIVVAKQRYLEIVSPYKTKAEELELEVGKPKRENAPKPSNPSTPPNMEFTADDIRNMSPAEYAKHREKILKFSTKN